MMQCGAPTHRRGAWRTRAMLGACIVFGSALSGCQAPTRAGAQGAEAMRSPSTGTAAPSSPRFAAGGPHAEEYGQALGYPVAAVHRPRFFVGAFSHNDQLWETRPIRRAEAPSRLTRATVEPAIVYRYEGQTRTLDDYLARNAATGLLIARGDTILVERYQYARHDRHRFASFSMAKTVIAMLIGIAID